MGPAFADLARLLVKLTKKGVDFNLTDEHTHAVRALKDKLVNYVTLQVPDPAKPYVLNSDASAYAMGAVLEQEGRPLGFSSKKMSPAEMRDVEKMLIDSRCYGIYRSSCATVFTKAKG